MNRSKWLTCLLFALGFTPALFAGNITGTVTSDNGALPGVSVTAKSGSSQETTVTNARGQFRFTNLADGEWTLTFQVQGFATESETTTLSGGQNATVDVTLIAGGNIMESMTVSAASRRVERIVEAPAAVSVIPKQEIALKAASGQIPRLLDTIPGVETTQSGVQDFNLNARGFNSSLNRRVLVLVDGRDPAVGFLGSQEWASISAAMEDYANMEFVRGPGSALYGANAFNGVLNITSKRPSEHEGGSLTLTGGDLDTFRSEFRYARTLGDGWAFRINAAYFTSESFERSRTVADLPFEYEGLSPERVPFGYAGTDVFGVPWDIENKYDGTSLGLRVDKEFDNGHLLTMEAGTTDSGGGVLVTGIGRVYVEDSERPFYRVNYNMPHFNFLFWQTDRDTPEPQTSLNSGGGLYEDSTQRMFEAQFNYDWMDGKVDLVAGASFQTEEIDTANPDGFQTLMLTPKDEDQTGFFAQLTFDITEQLEIVVAGRHDDSSLHDAQTSPKAGIVWKINPNHTLRLTYNEAFQTPNYSEFFLRAVAGSIPFDQLELAIEGTIFQATGLQIDLPLNWQTAPVMAMGNDALTVEENKTTELGYKGIIGSKLFVTADYYQSNIKNFVTDLLPGVNPVFGPLQLDGVPPELQPLVLAVLQGALGPLAAGLTNGTEAMTFVPIGHPTVVLSYANAGDVDLDGIELSFRYYVNDNWVIDGAYATFDFDVNDQLAGDRLLPNASENKFNLGVTYTNDKINSSLTYKHTEGFPWAAGAFFTPPGQDVPDFDVVNFSLSYQMLDWLRFNVDVANLLDEEHYQSFGGSIIERRALAGVKFTF